MIYAKAALYGFLIMTAVFAGLWLMVAFFSWSVPDVSLFMDWSGVRMVALEWAACSFVVWSVLRERQK